MKKKSLFLFISVVTLSIVTLFYVEQRADEFKKKDIKRWEKGFNDAVQKGDKLFHSALGSNSVSCDMCHPNGANTHPESYPKFQKQLGRVAALREMINWCIENPLEGKPLKPNDKKMILLEAYITWERRGVPLSPGKH
ncbi:cytochrome C [Spirochaetota bacterium]